MKIDQSLLAFFYPNKCMLCQRLLHEDDDLYVCYRCREKITAEVIPYKSLYTKEEEYPIQIMTLFPYESEYRKAILRWKYQGIRKYAKGFAKLLVEEIDFSVYDEAVFIPIPLAVSRKRKRGYNQALDLAVELSKLTGILVCDYLVRHKDTKPQSKCTKEEREKNIKNTMRIRKSSELTPKNIFIVDDIYTTGSTIKEAIRVIKQEFLFRKAKIYVIVVGKGELFTGGIEDGC